MTSENPDLELHSTNQANSPRFWEASWFCPALITIVGTLIYVNSFSGQIVFDDVFILDDMSIRTLWPPWHSMFSAENAGRPLVGLSFAVNYALSGLELWSYHLVNLILHLLAGLTLFGVARRTLLAPRLAERFGKASTGLALAVALIWVVHPLQTESVTYIIQRAEAMVSLFYLLTLYCVIRGLASARPASWYAAAVLSSAAGMAAKPVMVSAPLIVLAWDLLFHSGSLKETLRRRAGLYGGLFASWVILAATVAAVGKSESAGFNLQGISAWAYFRSQFAVIVYYLKLSLWPVNLCLDYGWRPAKTAGEIVPYAIVVVLLGLAAAVALKRKPEAGFVGLCFFLILAPTSSFMPLLDLIAEHRMYLALAAVLAFVVIGAYAGWNRLDAELTAKGSSLPPWVPIAAVAIVVAWFGSLTVERNAYYQSKLVMWADVVRKAPGNPRGHNNLGLYLAERGEFDAAIEQLSKALEISPDFPEANNNMGMALMNSGRPAEAQGHIERALAVRPELKNANFNLGQILASQGRWEDAVTYYRRELETSPQNIDVYRQLCMALERQKRFAEAVSAYREALSFAPNAWDLQCRLALVMSDPEAPEVRDLQQAVQLVESAARLTNRQRASVLDVAASVYSSAGRFDDAVAIAQEALGLQSAQNNQQLVKQLTERIERYRAHRPARP
jgi:tetratricopeptide (TPR) repeat protein